MQANEQGEVKSSLTTSDSIGNTVESFVDTVVAGFNALDAPDKVIDDIETQGQLLTEQIDEIEQQVEDNTDDIQETQEHAGRERAELSARLSEVEDAVSGDTTPAPDAGETGIQRADLTPIEQLAQSTNIEEVTDSPTVRRAVSLFKNLTDWGSKTPRGIVLKPADNPLRLLEADRDENLAWKQYYRSAEALERLSHGSVTFVDHDRHGKMLVLHSQSEAFERLTSGSLSVSSVEATS